MSLLDQTNAFHLTWTRGRKDQALSRVPDYLYTSETTTTEYIEKYVAAALRLALIEQLEDGTWYAEVAELPGVWAASDSETDLPSELELVLRGWLALKREDGDTDVPVLEGIDLRGL